MGWMYLQINWGGLTYKTNQAEMGGSHGMSPDDQPIGYAAGYLWHLPCTRDVFPRPGKMMPSTILTGEFRRYRCESCGWEWDGGAAIGMDKV